MLSFLSDYNEGAHPKLLRALEETNFLSLPGYGEDALCLRAREKLRAFCGDAEADVYFLMGGTQANLVAISSLLRRYEAVLCASSGHINTHEAGAVEFTGHKVVPLAAEEGKLPAPALEEYLEGFYADESHSHMPFPGLVYLSQPTELGTLYTGRELRELSALCRRYGLRLYVDGARLGYGLAAGADIRDLVDCCDAFLVGGTKVGALCGEALVFPRHGMPAHFDTMAKQQGAMLSKGRLLGAQFDALFTGGLYLELGRHGVEQALRLKKALVEKGYELLVDSPTNQQFVIVDDAALSRLREKAAFNLWSSAGPGRSAIRLVTSWATAPETVDALIALL